MTNEEYVAKARWAEMWSLLQACATRRPAALDRAARFVAEVAMTAVDLENTTQEELEAAAAHPAVEHREAKTVPTEARRLEIAQLFADAASDHGAEMRRTSATSADPERS